MPGNHPLQAGMAALFTKVNCPEIRPPKYAIPRRGNIGANMVDNAGKINLDDISAIPSVRAARRCGLKTGERAGRIWPVPP